MLAGWTIGAPQWAEFLALDERLSKGTGGRNNTLAKPRAFPAGGLEVIVGRNALLVGDDFQIFSWGPSRRVDILATTPACLDFVSIGEHDDECSFRFPSARATPSAAGLISDHYNAACRVGATERDSPA